MKKLISGLLFAIIITFSNNSHAEKYIALQLGISMPENLTNTTGDETLGYSTPTPNVQYGTDVSNTDLRNSPYIGLKVGKYFENKSNFGIEAEFAYTKPDFKNQDVYLTNKNFSDEGFEGDTFFENQLKASAKLYTLGINGLYRFETKQNVIRPYIGAGPALYIWHITGSGNSCRVGGDISSECNAPGINERALGLGFVAKTGISYDINDKLSLDFEYKYNWNRQKFSHFRSLSNIKTTYQAHNLIAGIAYKF